MRDARRKPPREAAFMVLVFSFLMAWMPSQSHASMQRHAVPNRLGLSAAWHEVFRPARPTTPPGPIVAERRNPAGLWPWIATTMRNTDIFVDHSGPQHYGDMSSQAIVGTAMGMMLPWLHKREVETGQKIGVRTIGDGDGAALMWSKHF